MKCIIRPFRTERAATRLPSREKQFGLLQRGRFYRAPRPSSGTVSPRLWTVPNSSSSRSKLGSIFFIRHELGELYFVVRFSSSDSSSSPLSARNCLLKAQSRGPNGHVRQRLYRAGKSFDYGPLNWVSYAKDASEWNDLRWRNEAERNGHEA